MRRSDSKLKSVYYAIVHIYLIIWMLKSFSHYEHLYHLNFGDCKPIKGAKGLHELRIHLGPGYRLYFGKAKDTLVIILCGGDKGDQTRDIEKDKEYWQLYNESRKEV